MSAYYNEFDPKAAAWLRELIKRGLIPQGDVDERSITDVQPDDLAGYGQCHFFAGIGGWPLAARLAGWPDDKPLWTGSPPCQPFSVAGRGAGTADPRHLWPDFFRLVRARRPAVLMGEQVAAAVGKDWFTGVRSDLESIGYVGRGVVVPACAVAAPHRRDRLWFVAASGVVGDSQCARLERHAGHDHDAPGREIEGRPVAEAGSGGVVEHALHTERRQESEGGDVDYRQDAGRHQAASGLASSVQDGAGGCNVADNYQHGCGAGQRHDPTARHRHSVAAACGAGHWDGAKWLVSEHDGKARRVEPSIPLLVDGLPSRAPLLRGYGNAIVVPLAAQIIGAWLDEYPES